MRKQQGCLLIQLNPTEHAYMRLLSSRSVITHCSSAFNRDKRLKETPLPLVSTFYLEILLL